VATGGGGAGHTSLNFNLSNNLSVTAANINKDNGN